MSDQRDNAPEQTIGRIDVTGERLLLGTYPGFVEREHLERYRFAERFVAGKDVLDVACGTGYGSAMLARADARSVTGVDVSPEAVHFADQNYASATVRFQQGDAQRLDTIADGSFDVVASFETIEHVADVNAYIAAVGRVLRPGGTYILSTPDRRLASTLYPIRRRPSNPFHVREFVRDELLKVLAPNFRVVECLGQGYINRVFVFWPVLIGLKGSCRALRGLGAHRLIDRIYYDETDREVKPELDHPGSIPSYWVVRCQKV